MTPQSYMPVAPRQDQVVRFAGPWEVEPNDSLAQANGPLRSGQDYSGYSGGSDDLFSFFSSAGVITLELAGDSDGGSQLILYCADDLVHSLVQDGEPPYRITYRGPAGWYVIRIHSAAGRTQAQPYTLRVTYP
jgi:hypothetical protein